MDSSDDDAPISKLVKTDQFVKQEAEGSDSDQPLSAIASPVVSRKTTTVKRERSDANGTTTQSGAKSSAKKTRAAAPPRRSGKDDDRNSGKDGGTRVASKARRMEKEKKSRNGRPTTTNKVKKEQRRRGEKRESGAATAKGRSTTAAKKEQSDGEDLVPGDARKYFKEGQKHITPPNGDGTRAFYESLYEENENSLIAIRYCVDYGILTGTKHHGALAKYEALKLMGAYKGQPGGLKPEVKSGVPKHLLAKYEKESRR